MMLPAHAGVILDIPAIEEYDEDAPRTCGGDPMAL